MLERKDIIEITSLRQLPANRRHIGYSGPLDDCLKAHNAQYTWEVTPQAFYLTTIGVLYVPAEWVRPVEKVAHSSEGGGGANLRRSCNLATVTL